MTTGTIAAVVPVQQGADYVGEAVTSLVTQTRPPLEVIVIANGCTDRSTEVARAAGASLVVERDACAPGPARNDGAALATAEYLGFLDADDVAMPDRFAIQGAVLDERPDVDLVVGAIETFVSPDRPQLMGTPLPPTRVARHVGSVLVRRRAFEAVGPFLDDPRGSEAVDWFRRAGEQGLVLVTVDDVVMRRRIHGGNLNLRVGSRTDLVDVAREALRRHRG